MLLNPSRQRDAAWRTVTVSLPILQHIGSAGGALRCHSGMVPGEEEAGGSHIVYQHLHYTWKWRSYEGEWIGESLCQLVKIMLYSVEYMYVSIVYGCAN